MTTYAIQCPKCKKWSAKSTHKILDYRFKCVCGKSLQVKSKRRVGFDVNIKQIDSVEPHKIISELNRPETHLTDFFTYSLRA